VSGNRGSGAGRSVASKIGSVLDAFLPDSPELSLTLLAERSGLPLTTTYRLVTELVEWGALERASAGGYRIAARLWQIGSLAGSESTVRMAALPSMQDLHEATAADVQLAVPAGREAQYVERITAKTAPPPGTAPGARVPLHATGVGKVLLAHSPPEIVDEVLGAGLARYTPHTMVDAAALARALTQIRRCGVAFSREELTLGVVSVAAPLFGGQGHVVAAISVVSTTGLDLRRLAPALRTAALGASRRLRGYPGDDPAAPVRRLIPVR
jgi:DNA-binding IclR family transcriptional regulator